MALVKEIINAFDIKKGDVVFISSDVLKMLFLGIASNCPVDLNHFIGILIDKVGPTGTLLFPTYNWDFCKGKTFDYHNTPSKTGSLGTFALKHEGFRRTKHPIYSFAVWGKDQEYLCSLNNVHSFGIDSPFAFLKEKNALNILLDVGFKNSFTFVHYVEEQSGCVKYRYQKMFHAKYIDEFGKISDASYSMFVRNLDLNVVNTIDPIAQIMEEKGIVQRNEVRSITIFRVRFAEAYPVIMDDIIHNKSRNICTYIGQED